MRLSRSEKQGGFTLIDAAFATAIVAIFFVTLFGLNSQCLYFVNSSRELMSAGQAAQGRLEQIRNLTWSQITTAGCTAPAVCLQTVLTPPMTGASSLGTVTEVVTINKYPTAVSPGIQLTRVGNGVSNVVPSMGPSPNAAIATGDMTTINVQLTWTAAPGGRPRSITTSTVYAKNSR